MALILLVEDEKLLRWALEQQLKRAGHQVHAAPDLATASEHLGAHQPDVVLLDLGLPDGHGLDFYEANRERLEGSVVIVMTALGAVEEAVRAMKLGALSRRGLRRSSRVRSRPSSQHAPRESGK